MINPTFLREFVARQAPMVAEYVRKTKARVDAIEMAWNDDTPREKAFSFMRELREFEEQLSAYSDDDEVTEAMSSDDIYELNWLINHLKGFVQLERPERLKYY